MDTDTVFAKIIRREIPADIVFEDNLCIAFRDLNPQAPVHILVIPKEPIASMQEIAVEHEAVLGRLLVIAHEIAADAGLVDGYRCVINTGADGGQTVDHLHIHLLGGRHMTWPPG